MTRTYSEIASSFDLWQEYADLAADRAEFDSMNQADRETLLVEAFGPEAEPAPTVADVLARCQPRGFTGTPAAPIQLLNWDGCAIPAGDLRAALEDAYDPTMPNWPAMVSIDA
jgi:hypothetical protein